MSSKFEEIVLEELFKLSTKVDNLQVQMQGMVTKEDIKDMATKEDLKKFATKEDIKDMATKEDLKKFATKEDLKKFATKEDLKKFATKEDLNKFATKEDLNKFATKEDLNKFPTKEYVDRRFNEQTAEIANMFKEAFKLSDKYHREMEERITKATDKKIENLRQEFLCQINARK